MVKEKIKAIDCRRVELAGIRYVILRESVYKHLCQMAHVKDVNSTEDETTLLSGYGLDRTSLAEKLIRRRRASGLSQLDLARRAGIRPETLNRIERGRTTPDFATIRKLVIAMNAAEREHLSVSITHTTDEE
jgi:DNA-binding XRE family transcriptional regulator